MPLFLVQGQRRVGKTSLLKFLPGILGPRFKIVFLELQNLNSIPEWFENIKLQFDQTLNIQEPTSPHLQGDNWSESWKRLQEYLQIHAEKEESNIILAFDEYEKVHRLFTANPQAAENLLDSMRSFSQHQDKIVFLFVGAAFFTELKDPYWSHYFVQAVTLKVDYLNETDTRKLINVVKLDYDSEVIDTIYNLTQGHPTLVQRICREIVNRANAERCRDVNMQDLEKVLQEQVYISVNGVTDVFWTQFCREPVMKETVQQIVNGQPPSDKQSVFRLQEHRFIIQEGGRYRMRVPIFEEWVRRFGEFI